MADLPFVTSDDLATFLGESSLDEARASLMLTLARQACEVYVSPLPDSALGVVLTVAARAYSSPTTATMETAGPFSVQRPAGGVYLTRTERQALKTLAGRGGAFSVDPTPADALQGLNPWNQNVTWLDGVPLAEDVDRR